MSLIKKLTAGLVAVVLILALCACTDKEFYSTDATIGKENDNDIESILSGTFYFDAVMESYGDTGRTQFALDGENIFMRAEMDGVELGMIFLGGVIYMVYGNEYAELTDTVLKMMDIDVEGDVPAQLGFNKEEILAMFTGLKNPTEESSELDRVKVTKITYDRESGGNTVVYIDKNGDMLRAESFSSKGTMLESMDFSEVTGVVPTELFILDNYEKTNILKLMFEASEAMGIEPTT